MASTSKPSISLRELFLCVWAFSFASGAAQSETFFCSTKMWAMESSQVRNLDNVVTFTLSPTCPIGNGSRIEIGVFNLKYTAASTFKVTCFKNDLPYPDHFRRAD
eukprot:344807-Hanusia_phi.AAC.2